MKRSERLALEGKVEVNIGNYAIATVITFGRLNAMDKATIYIGTDYEALYNGKTTWVDIYEDDDGNLYGVIE